MPRIIIPWRERFAKYVPQGLPPDQCWPWTGARMKAGYGAININGRVEYAHRLMWGIANGPIPDGAHIRHLCDNPPCVNPAHLLPGSHADNMRDRTERGRHRPPRLIGEAHGMHRLTDEIVVAIRSSKLTPTDLAAMYGVTRENIYMVLKRKTWRHLP